MNSAKKYFKIVVFSTPDKKPRHINLPSYLPKFGLMLFLLIFIVCGALSYSFIRYFHGMYKQISEMEFLRTENDKQKTIINEFSQKIKTFDSKLSHLDDLNKKINNVPILDELESLKKSPKGGPEFIKKMDFGFEENNFDFSINNLSDNLEYLMIKADIYEQNFEKINRFIDNKYLLAKTDPDIPSILPVIGKITSGFGFRESPFSGEIVKHNGLDIKAPENTSIIATANGVVIRAEKEATYGNMVEIQHKNGVSTRFGHLLQILVKEGDQVKKGQVIGTVGSTGRSTGEHLHYEVEKNNVPLNPLKYIKNLDLINLFNS